MRRALLVFPGLLLAACGTPRGVPEGSAVLPEEGPYASTYQRIAAPPVLIENATILTGDGRRLDRASLLLRDGVVAAVGREIAAPDAVRVDAAGKWVTPGIIDSHSHLGVYASPAVAAHAEGNEMTDPNTAEVWAEHGVWPQDPGFNAARAGGVTTMQVLPGSANLFGGRTVTLKNVPARTVQAMKFPGAPHGLKMACGENPKRIYGLARQAFPMTRMGDVAGYRAAFAKAADYRQKWQEYRDGVRPQQPDRDLELDTLARVLDGEINVHHHCYRADEMVQVLDVAREFGYTVASFHHATEAYKVADVLAANEVCASIWADWWGFKMEALDGIRENAALLHKAGACVIIHSDSATGIQRLNQEAAKAMASAVRMGVPVDEAEAIRWVTENPARALGIVDRTGTLAPGKMADVVVWDGNPFSVYTHAEKVFVDGALLYDRGDVERQPVSDFMLGILPPREIAP